jgi:hypothetical protein
MPVIDAAIPDGCCGIQGEHWRRITDEGSPDDMRLSRRQLDRLREAHPREAIALIVLT